MPSRHSTEITLYGVEFREIECAQKFVAKVKQNSSYHTMLRNRKCLRESQLTLSICGIKVDLERLKPIYFHSTSSQ